MAPIKLKSEKGRFDEAILWRKNSVSPEKPIQIEKKEKGKKRKREKRKEKRTRKQRRKKFDGTQKAI